MQLSIPFDGVLDQAEDIINGLWTAYTVPIGLGLGFTVLAFIVASIRKAI